MPERRKLEIILLENKLVSVEQLTQVTSYAHAVGIDLHEAVLQKKIASPEAVMMAYAESVGLPFIHLADVSVDESVALHIDPMIARQYSFIPISIDQGHVLLATTKPVILDVMEELRMAFDLPVRCVICTPADLSAALTEHYPRGAVRIARTEPNPAPQTVSKPKKKPVPIPAEPMGDEAINDRFWKSVVAFNFAFAFACFALNYLQLLRGIYNAWYYFPTLVLIGALTGGLAALATWRTLSR